MHVPSDRTSPSQNNPDQDRDNVALLFGGGNDNKSRRPVFQKLPRIGYSRVVAKRDRITPGKVEVRLPVGNVEL